MKLEEAIKYAEDMAALSQKGSGNTECEHNHRQLAEWLKELQTYRNRECETCKNSENGKCAGTEECHKCMWQNQYDQEPCEDCISRKAVLDTLDASDKFMDEDRTVETYKALLKECYEVLPPVTPQQRWIPTSERLPENDDFMIVTIKDEFGDSQYIYSDFGWYLDKANCWIIDAQQRTDIIAWLPLPEPYKEG